jgi:hypothetical protein
MREITTHKVNGCNDALKLTAVDEPGSGGANHVYDITPTIGNAKGLRIEFQNGPIKEGMPPNGLTNEVLLAVVQDRLCGFQTGKFACDDNAEALELINKAISVLQRRTLARVARGVEGTLQV